jgi:hypothetical protein
MIYFDLILPMNFSILPTTSDDLSKILALNQAALPAVSSVAIDEMAHFLNIADYFKIISVEGGIAGFLIALTTGKDYHSINYKWFENKYNSFIYVDRIVIAPEFYSQGLGRALYDDLSNFSKSKAPRITCEVNIRPMNQGSILFHEKYGFTQVGTQETDGGKKEVSLMAFESKY